MGIGNGSGSGKGGGRNWKRWMMGVEVCGREGQKVWGKGLEGWMMGLRGFRALRFYRSDSF